MFIKKQDGSNIIINENNCLDSFIIIIAINVGSIDEYPDFNYGLAHFTEHMIFKGTNNINKSIDLLKFIDNIGGETNASTDYNITKYYIKVPYRNQIDACSILFDMVFNSIINKKEFDIEKNVVIEEILKSNDDPSEKNSDIMYKELFKDTPYKTPIAGYIDTVKKITREEMLNFINKFYVSSNTTIGVYGKVYKKTINFLKKITMPIGNINFRDFNQKINKNLHNNQEGIFKFTKDNLEQSIFSISFRICGIENKNRYILEFISHLLSGNMSSYLYKQLREKNGLVYNINSSVDIYPYTGCFSINGGCTPKNIIKSISLIIHEINKLKKKKYTKMN